MNNINFYFSSTSAEDQENYFTGDFKKMVPPDEMAENYGIIPGVYRMIGGELHRVISEPQLFPIDKKIQTK